MPLRSASRSEVRRRGRHKVYHDHQLASHPSPPGSPRRQASAGVESRHCERGAVKTDSCGSREDRKTCAAGIPSSVGPGAEPPVAVASHAFAHEKTERNPDRRSIDGCLEALSCSQSDGESGGGMADERATCTGGGAFDSLDRHSPDKNHANDRDAHLSEPDSTNNGEEAETLPESFNLSDECGPEGASTGRKHDDPGDLEEPRFFCPTVKIRGDGRGTGRDQPARFVESSSNDDDSSIITEGEDGDVHGEETSGISERSDCLSLSPRRRTSRRLGRRSRQPRRSLTMMNRDARVVPSDDFVDLRTVEGEGERQHQHITSKESRYYRSPQRRRHSRGAQKQRRRRRTTSNTHRDRNLANAETPSFSGGVEAEMARLRRENHVLKQQQERSRSTGRGVQSVDRWSRYAEEPLSRDSSSGSSRQRELARPTVRQKERRLAREEDTLAKRTQQERRARARASTPQLLLYPNDTSSVLSSSTRKVISPRPVAPTSWSDFVSKNQSSSNSAGTAWGVEPKDSGVDLDLPRILVEGGFLWKIPYHSAGTPKRRWFQIKPAKGLLTTANGRLVVNPTASGRMGDNSSLGGQGGGEDASSIRVCAAWPLAFIWVDPERDLQRSPPREMGIDEIMDIARGHKTPAFWQQAAHRGIHTLPTPELCFSLMGHDRTLDLAAESLPDAKQWVHALVGLALRNKRGELNAGDAFAVSVSPRSRLESTTTSAIVPQCFETLDVNNKPVDPHRWEQIAGTEAMSPRLPRRHSAAANTSTQEPHAYRNPPTEANAGEWSVNTMRAWRRRLFPAVSRGDTVAVLALFDQGCPVDLVQTGSGDTALLLACRLGDIDLVAECLRRGSRNDPHPDFGQTALQAAVASGQEECARILLETAAPSGSDAVVANHKDPNRETPLHVASWRGYTGIVEALLYHGADLCLVDRDGNTPLHGAARAGHTNALASLLDAGGDAVLEQRNARGDRALHSAAASGHIACVQLLLETAAEPDVPNADGKTPFNLASIGGHLAVTRLIRQYAPAAGTPSGGDAKLRADGPKDARGGATADALPRPHASGSSVNGPPGPTEHPSRDLEQRCYSAARLGRHSLELSRSPSTRLTAQSFGDNNFEESPRRSRRSSRHHEEHDGGLSPSNYRSSQGQPPTVDTASPADDGCDSSPCGAPVHGSLFDGLQVYVVGGRQPLGSQHDIASAGGIMSSTASNARPTTEYGSCPSHQQQQQQQQRQQQEYPHHFQEPLSLSYSTAAVGCTAWGSVLSSPSTMAPSPPCGNPLASPIADSSAKLDSDDRSESMAYSSTDARQMTNSLPGGLCAVPGSARALARMLHFSNLGVVGRGHGEGNESATAWASSHALNIEKDVRKTGGCAQKASVDGAGETSPAIGSWMTSNNCEVYSNGNDVQGVRHIGGGGDGGSGSTEGATVVAHRCGDETSLDRESNCLTGALGHASEKAATTDIDEKREVDPADSFVMFPGRAGVLPGLWRVLQSEGYPYYLHEGSGHSQWEDPRDISGSQESLKAAATVDDEGEPAGTGGRRSVAAEGGLSKESAARTVPASPIKPVAIAVAVEVSRFDVNTAVPVPIDDSTPAARSTSGVDGSSKSQAPPGCVPHDNGTSDRDENHNSSTHGSGAYGGSNMHVIRAPSGRSCTIRFVEGNQVDDSPERATNDLRDRSAPTTRGQDDGGDDCPDTLHLPPSEDADPDGLPQADEIFDSVNDSGQGSEQSNGSNKTKPKLAGERDEEEEEKEEEEEWWQGLDDDELSVEARGGYGGEGARRVGTEETKAGRRQASWRKEKDGA